MCGRSPNSLRQNIGVRGGGRHLCPLMPLFAALPGRYIRTRHLVLGVVWLSIVPRIGQLKIKSPSP